ncbi:TPA: hypothetical protein K8N17_002490 [Clostridium perfringens]|uniref:hypothetical protein n=1 Tax=Clostridium perfringens TaxID=1502 RepID=UPI001CAEE054|nr:hypothetical protein [Clostridium perfringens]HBI6993130.1 hypothetical protein [Clostridium perfringens]HBI6999148.1 hypothetical protein [Clostridium perfringens]HBI7025808.1 hypothetical protein [Clostridium perfringens]HBI7059258.1 hypothetical protein [Clostridium perfringens]
MAKNKRYKRLAKRMKAYCVENWYCECPYERECEAIKHRKYGYPDNENIRFLEKQLKGVNNP